MEQNTNMHQLYGMDEEAYLKEYFNKVNSLTAICHNTECWLHGGYEELEVGKEYKVTYISVRRSSSLIMLEGFGNKAYNAGCFVIRENGKEINYTKERRFLSPHLLKMYKCRHEHYGHKIRISNHLQEIEEQYHVKILLAVESGSRAGGFASKDSDWDVRFIYVHEPKWYYQIEEQKDTIEIMFPDEVDASGWDLKKALRLFKRSNPSFFEWIHSPIIYEIDETFITEIKKMEDEYFDADKAMFHYNHIYKKHNDRYITENGLPLKRFLYYLRGILVCKWLTDNGTIPPVRFSELVDATIEDENIKKKIEHLLEQKKQSKEHNLEPVDEELFAWAEKWAEYYNQKVEKLRPEKKISSDEQLNKLMFDTVLRKASEPDEQPDIILFK